MIRTVVITGWHSGPNPSPGLGVALSIRQSFPDVRIIAMDYSNRATGLYHDVVNQRIVFPKWSDMDRGQYQEDVRALLHKEDAVFFSCLDLEVDVLAGLRQREDGWRLVIPRKSTVRAARKPCVAIAETLGLAVPDTSFASDSMAVQKLVARHGWPLQVKGKRYESISAHNSLELESCAARIHKTWHDDALVQQTIHGEEHSVAFAAYEGKLLGCIGMKKTELTELGKTWCGRLYPVSPEQQRRISRFIQEFNWTGGGELEMIRADADGLDYLTDVNPRFPAWIYGASINGYNLPATLFAEAVGGQSPMQTPVAGSFVRVVTEVVAPALMELDEGASRRRDFGKGHPSGMTELARGMDFENESPEDPENDADVLSSDKGAWLDEKVCEMDDRPCRIFDYARFVSNVKNAKRLVADVATGLGVDFVISYSVKTNPTPKVLEAALRCGLNAECISLAELDIAQKLGFAGSACTLNGPGKWWPQKLAGSVAEPMVVNCDSLCDLHKTVAMLDAYGWSNCILGVRISPPGIKSRFGMNLEDPQTFAALCGELQRIPNTRKLGVHFHYAQSSLGSLAWAETAKRAMKLASAAFGCASRRVSHLDLGGGWRIGDAEDLKASLKDVCRSAKGCFDGLRAFQIEPGKLLVEDCGYLVCRVFGRRGMTVDTDVVVSAACSDVPDVLSFAHEVIWRKAKGGPWRRLSRGHGSILGRICMESDVLRRGVAIPDEVDEGDLIVICDTGAYDTSMAYPFGMGVNYVS